MTVLDWLAQLLGLPRGWHGHIEDTASTATVAALAAARTQKPGGVVYASEQANFSVEKAARLVGLEFRAVEVGRRRSACGPTSRSTTRLPSSRPSGTTGTTSVDPVPELARRCEEAGVWLHVDAAYAGLGRRLPRAALVPRRRRARRLGRRQPAQVALHADGLLDALDAPAGGVPRGVLARAATTSPSTEAAVDLKDYGPALGRRFRALKLWAVLRWYGAEGLRALIREHVRLAQLFAALVEAEPGWEVVAPHPFSAVCFRHATPTTTRSRARRPRRASSSSHAASLRGKSIDSPRDRQRADDRGRHPPIAGRCCASCPRAVIFDLWETLIDWDREAAAALGARWLRSSAATSVSVGAVSANALQRARSGLRWPTPVCRTSAHRGVCATPPRVHTATRSSRAPARSTRFAGCASDGYLVGLITVCSEDIETLWPESEFAGLFDAEVFSSRVGMSKPDPEIYLHCCDLLGVEPNRGGVRRRRRERRARGRASRRDGGDPHPPRGRWPVLARARGLGWTARHVDPRGAGGAGAVLITTDGRTCRATRSSGGRTARCSGMTVRLRADMRLADAAPA